MTLSELIPSGAASLALIGLVVNYIRDRRKERAASAVAEATVPHQIDLSSTTAAEAQFVLTQKIWDAQRASLEQQITAANKRADDAEAREARKHTELQSVRAELDQLRLDFNGLQEQLALATRRVAELLDDDDEPNHLMGS